jgi:sulfite oxidase
VLVDQFITPNELHYVRNHLPVPSNRGTIATHRITVEADPEFNLRKAELTVDDLKSKFEPLTLTVTLQCAGNRRNDMCAVETVSLGAPWNAGETFLEVSTTRGRLLLRMGLKAFRD